MRRPEAPEADGGTTTTTGLVDVQALMCNSPGPDHAIGLRLPASTFSNWVRSSELMDLWARLEHARTPGRVCGCVPCVHVHTSYIHIRLRTHSSKEGTVMFVLPFRCLLCACVKGGVRIYFPHTRKRIIWRKKYLHVCLLTEQYLTIFYILLLNFSCWLKSLFICRFVHSVIR